MPYTITCNLKLKENCFFKLLEPQNNKRNNETYQVKYKIIINNSNCSMPFLCRKITNQLKK